jgi:hypothetical protein
MVIHRVKFASYGTPTGGCHNFSIGECDAVASKHIVEDLCIGKNDCSISASSYLFRDTCKEEGDSNFDLILDSMHLDETDREIRTQPILEENSCACVNVDKHLRIEVECDVGDSFHEDFYFNAFSQRHWANAIAETPTRKEDWQEFLDTVMEYPAHIFSGRGIVIVAGGKYFEPATVMIHLIRKLGFTNQIQVWHLGEEEMTPVHRKLLEPYDVETRDFYSFVDPAILKPIQANVGMRLFQLKPLALLHSDLQEILHGARFWTEICNSTCYWMHNCWLEAYVHMIQKACGWLFSNRYQRKYCRNTEG